MPERQFKSETEVHLREMTVTAECDLHSSGVKNNASRFSKVVYMAKEQWPQHRALGDTSGELVKG